MRLKKFLMFHRQIVRSIKRCVIDLLLVFSRSYFCQVKNQFKGYAQNIYMGTLLLNQLYVFVNWSGNTRLRSAQQANGVEWKTSKNHLLFKRNDRTKHSIVILIVVYFWKGYQIRRHEVIENARIHCIPFNSVYSKENTSASTCGTGTFYFNKNDQHVIWPTDRPNQQTADKWIIICSRCRKYDP